MPLAPPRTLSPSKVTSFTDCALAFRFSVIDHVPEPPSLPASRGTLVHAALERLFGLTAPARTVDAAQRCLADAWADLRDDPEFTGLDLDLEGETTLLRDAGALVEKYFELEDPRTINPIGLELMLQVPLGGVLLRGIIDRLELDHDGELVVTDYKTGRAPNERHERGRLGGVHFYSYLCEQLFGKRPARIQLLYLADPVTIVAVPTDQTTRGLQTKVGAIWHAVERACANDDFRPKTGPLCSWCNFKAYCPAYGGDPEQARFAAREARTGEVPLPLGAAPA
jgi:putative RecB family exonuclease